LASAIAVAAVVVALFVGFWLVSVFNQLVRLRNGAKNALAGVDVQLKQRCGLVPSVVAAVKGYMKHEQKVLEELTALRGQALAPGVGQRRRFELDAHMSGLLQRLMVQVENYPDLKASQNVEQLQRTLNELEAQIAAARRTYNACVTDLNNAVEVFPANLVAPAMGFTLLPFFEAAPTDRAVPDVNALMNR
jgi:LemA protein